MFQLRTFKFEAETINLKTKRAHFIKTSCWDIKLKASRSSKEVLVVENGSLTASDIVSILLQRFPRRGHTKNGKGCRTKKLKRTRREQPLAKTD